MRYRFTSSPFEALMTKIPPAPKPEPPPKPPEGHFCYGCARYGLGQAVLQGCGEKRQNLLLTLYRYAGIIIARRRGT